MTLQLLWEEYRQAHPEGYGYSRFCELYQRWRNKLDVVLRQEHKPGEKMFVDWAGSTIPIHDPQGGPPQAGHLFVAVLGTSSYTYAEATSDEQLTNWIGAHVRAFEFYQGVPALVVPDNTKTGVTKACRYDPDLNPTYQELATHYGVGVIPARPYKPRDKAKAESGVQIVERWIIAALRHHQFFSLGVVNIEKKLFERCAQYKSHRWSNGISEGEVTGDQIQTFMMLLMYTGLRISDAATFSTDKLQSNNAFLFMHKTNEPVFTWIPDDLVARLKNLPLQRGKYYFMGPVTERKETAADMWRRKLSDIFDMAGPWKIKPTPHRFRHTFARLLLQRGVPIDDVATLMGHSDPKITLKHYGHWVPERQERLTDILKSAWQPKIRSKLTLIKAGAK